MSDSSLSKAAKKNQKRAERRAQERAQKLKEEGVIDRLKEENVDPMTKLKIQLQEAKENKDHKLAAQLRKDIWILQDKSAGKIPPGEDLDSLETQVVELQKPDDKGATTGSADNSNLLSENCPAEMHAEKKIRKLKKKLQQIEILKGKQDDGEELNKCQIAKVQCEEEVLREITELEELLENESGALTTEST